MALSWGQCDLSHNYTRLSSNECDLSHRGWELRPVQLRLGWSQAGVGCFGFVLALLRPAAYKRNRSKRCYASTRCAAEPPHASGGVGG